MYLDNANNALINHISHNSEFKMKYNADGSPMPKEVPDETYFRKAVDHYTHDAIPEGVINDPH